MESDTISELIWNGQSIEDSGHLQELRRLFLENLCTSETDGLSIQSRISSCKSALERIQTVQESFRWIPVPQNIFQNVKKNPVLSSNFRERANLNYKQQNLVAALRGYNLAIAFGRPGEQELGLAYANRAALFLQVKEPSEALKDIELARTNSFPQNLMGKLEERANKCRDMIEMLKIQKSNETLSDQALKDYSNNTYFVLKRRSPAIIGAEDYVELVNSEDRGRRVIANQDIPAGSLILVEKPYATALDLELKWDTQHCQFCLKRILGGIPCLHCTFALYCNDKCRSQADHFHQHEHNILAYLHAIKSSQRDLIATRIIELLGPSKLLSLFQETQKDDHSFTILTEASTPGFDQNYVYDASTYGPIFHLVSHSEQELLNNVSNAFKAILLTNLLKEQSNFFQQMQNNEQNLKEPSQLFDFTASLILHHLENIPYNAISLNEFRCDESNSKIQRGNLLRQKNNPAIKSVPYASAIFGLLAMCNHSCSPNAVHVRSVERHETALVTLKSLRAGDEICITYGPLFTVHDFEDRQRILKDKYNFDCSCDACTNHWSLKDPSEGIALDKYKKVEFFEKELHQAHELIEQSKYIAAISKLQPCLNFFGSNFSQTFPLTQVAQDLFKKALIYVVNC